MPFISLRPVLLQTIALLVLSCLGPVSGKAQAQVVTTSPAFPVVDEPVTITFAAAEGNGALVGYSGTVYIHTGVITSQSAVKDGCGPDAANWRYVKTAWGQNTTATALAQTSPGVYQFTIDDIRAYYGVPEGEDILRLAMVFRNSSGTITAKDTGNCDIFVDVFQGGLGVALLSPAASVMDPLILLGPSSVEVLATAIVENGEVDNMTFLVNGVEQASVASDTLAYIWNVTEPGVYDARVVASQGGQEADSEFQVVLGEDVVDAPRPAGIVDGINYHASPSDVTLSAYAPFKDIVHVIGDMTAWRVDPAYTMKRDAIRPDSVHWWITLDNVTPGEEYAFQYLMDGTLRIADPYTEKVLSAEDAFISSATYPDLKPYPTNLTRHAVSTFQTGRVPYEWQATDFQPPPKGELVIYELLVRDFVADHDWATLTDTLGYLERLGVNAIELMPPNEFEGNESWGYNPSFYFAPDKYYGPADDLKRFVDAAHARGMAVIMDIVLNHSFGQAPLVRQYQDASGNASSQNPWFNETCAHPTEGLCFGQDFNHESPETRAFVDRTLAWWLTEFNMDGFRFDLTKGLTNNNSGSNYDADRIAIVKRMLDRMWDVKPDAYAILEHWTGPTEERELAEHGAMVWTNVNNAFMQSTMGYLENSDFRGMYFGRRGWTLPHVVSYMESHDEERVMYKALQFGNASGAYDVKDVATALERVQAAAAQLLLTPGPRMIWQFGELGYDVSIDENGRTGNKPIRWDYYSDPARRALYDTYAGLIALRKEHDVFHDATTSVTQEVNSLVRTATLTHAGSGEAALVISNFDVVPKTVTLQFPDTGRWYDVFEGTTVDLVLPTLPLTLSPGTFHVFMNREPRVNPLTVDSERPETSLPTAVQLAQNWPNPFNTETNIAFSLPAAGAVRMDVFTSTGQRVATLMDGTMPPGTHTVQFRGKDLVSGTYFIRMTTPYGTQTRPMVMIR